MVTGGGKPPKRYDHSIWTSVLSNLQAIYGVALGEGASANVEGEGGDMEEEQEENEGDGERDEEPLSMQAGDDGQQKAFKKCAELFVISCSVVARVCA
jgi:hypothetical protein